RSGGASRRAGKAPGPGQNARGPVRQCGDRDYIGVAVSAAVVSIMVSIIVVSIVMVSDIDGIIVSTAAPASAGGASSAQAAAATSIATSMSFFIGYPRLKGYGSGRVARLPHCRWACRRSKLR